jgi:hypothetical protein
MKLPSLLLILIFVLSTIVLIMGCNEDDEVVDIDPNHDYALVGTWHQYTYTGNLTTYFLPEKWVFNQNGSGTNWIADTLSGETVVKGFSWHNNDNELILEYDGEEAEEPISYLISGVQCQFSKGSEFTRVAIKEYDQNKEGLIGKWTNYYASNGGDFLDDMSTLDFSEDGTCTEYFNTDNPVTYDWSTSGVYLVDPALYLIRNKSYFTDLSQVNIYNPQGNSVTLSGQGDEYKKAVFYSYIKDVDSTKTDLVGNWILESRLINGEETGGSEIFILGSDGSGSHDIIGGFSWNYNHGFNQGTESYDYFIFYPIANRAGYAWRISVDTDSCIISYLNEDGASVLETYTRQDS